MDEVVPLPHEVGVARHADVHVEIAGDAAPRCRRSPLREAQALALVDAGGHVHVERAGAVHAPVAAAGLARRRDELAGAGAGLARRRRHQLAEQAAAHLAHLTPPFAGGARLGVRAGRGAAAAAHLALDRHARFDRLAGAEHDLVQRQLDRELRVRAAPGAALATAPEATERVAAEERVEQVVEPEVARGSGTGTGARAAVAVVAEHVVAAPAFGVAQRLVRALDLLETLRRRRIVRVGVRVVLARERAVRLLQLFVGALPGAPEHFVVIKVSHAGSGFERSREITGRVAGRDVGRRLPPRPAPCDSPSGSGRGRRRYPPARLPPDTARARPTLPAGRRWRSPSRCGP